MSRKKAVSMKEVMSLFADNLDGKALIKSDLINQICCYFTHRRMNEKLTQEQFAEKYGLSQTEVSNIEGGNINFTLDKIADLADKMDCHATIYFTGNKHDVVQKNRAQTISVTVKPSYSSKAVRDFTVSNEKENLVFKNSSGKESFYVSV